MLLDLEQVEKDILRPTALDHPALLERVAEREVEAVAE